MEPDGAGSDDCRTVFAEDRFSDFKLLGMGGNAVVYGVYDRSAHRRVALKIDIHDSIVDGLGRGLLDELGLGHAELDKLVAKARAGTGRYTLEREAELLVQVSHPNVIDVFEVGLCAGDRAFAIILPLMEGGTLTDQDPLDPWQNVLERALPIGEGLAALHAAGIIHRDFKPNNVLFDSEGRPRIIDLGLACRLDDEAAMAELVGTGTYMSPEALGGRRRDSRDDLYAYCIVVFEMFYGHSPFASIEARLCGEVSKIERPHGMSPRLHEVIVKGLHPDADQRWPDMPTLLDAMHQTAVTESKPSSRAWKWGAAVTTLAASLVLGIVGTTRTAEADECAEVARALASWSPEVANELRIVSGSRKISGALDSWARRWVAVRAQECEAAKLADRADEASPCSATMRERFDSTIAAFSSSYSRSGLSFGSVIARLPDPEHCLDHPDDTRAAMGDVLEQEILETNLRDQIAAERIELARTLQGELMDRAVELGSKYGITRAVFHRGAIHLLVGELDEAERDFHAAYADAIMLDAPVLAGEAMMKLVEVAGAQGDTRATDNFALAARGLFARYEPGQLPTLMQAHGLALMSGDADERDRGLKLLVDAIELRKQELAHRQRTHEQLSQAHENYGRGLLLAGHAEEALGYLDRALAVHKDEYGELAWRTRRIQRQQFLALVELRRIDDAAAVGYTLMKSSINSTSWAQLERDVFWLAGLFADVGAIEYAIRALDTAQEQSELNSQTDLAQSLRAATDAAHGDLLLVEAGYGAVVIADAVVAPIEILELAVVGSPPRRPAHAVDAAHRKTTSRETDNRACAPRTGRRRSSSAPRSSR